MNLLGLIPEPPFDPQSWSGSSAFFFQALRSQGMLADAAHVRLSPLGQSLFKVRSFSPSLPRWRERYHANIGRFNALSRVADREIKSRAGVDSAIQIGAWFSAARDTSLPCFSYHDGNAAMWYRQYNTGLLSSHEREAHLAWERSVYQSLTGIFVMSNWLGSSFIKDFGVPQDKVHVVGAGINFPTLPDISERDFSHPRFLFVGRDFVRKGGKYLLEAFRIVKRQVPSAELTIVGPEMSTGDAGVTFAGYMTKSNPVHAAQLNQLFQSSTALILPSIYEPFGISLTEGMAYGLPCIAADRCAMPEIVLHRQSGLVVPPESAIELANAMLELSQNPLEAKRMGQVGRARVETDFTWNAVVLKIKAVLTHKYGLNA